MVHLEDKDFKATINMAKELKKIIFQDLKKSITTINQNIYAEIYTLKLITNLTFRSGEIQ